MAHMQQQIAAALQALIVAASTDAGSRVFIDLPDELSTDDVPAVVITLGDESIAEQSFDGHTPLQLRELALDITAVTRGSSAAAQGRNIGGQIEAAVWSSAANAHLSGLVESLSLTGVRPNITGHAATIVHELRQTWRCTYTTVAGTPDAPAS